MTIENLKNQLTETAKDIKLNLSTILTEEGAPDLTQNQIGGIALASAYATKNKTVIDAIHAEVSQYLTEAEINAAKSSATIMAMNNIYYRFVHLVKDTSFASMPAKLRMNVIGNPGVDKINFELNCLAVSAINGCGLCLDSHTEALSKAGASKLGIQSCIRIAAVINGTAMGVSLF
ncbi:MAG: carboxymuconolactone decarboxylase family protein [Pseudomonadota bacterium]